jgi:hypothetical protein
LGPLAGKKHDKGELLAGPRGEEANPLPPRQYAELASFFGGHTVAQTWPPTTRKGT